MKRIHITLIGLFLVLAYYNVQGQTSESPINISLVGGSLGYIGDLNDNSLSLFDPFNGQIGGNLGIYLSPSFDLNLQITDGNWGASEENGLNRSFESNTALGLALLKYKFNNGLIMKEDAGFRPFLALGAGVAEHRGDFVTNGSDHVFSIGPGINIPLDEKWGLTVQGLYNWHSQDFRDNFDSRDNKNDKSFLLTVGLGYGISMGTDSDGDGVVDKKDICPDTPMNTPVDEKGCPFDRDGDGITDALDLCPDQAGSATANGCPDSDGDGISDAEDECPNKPGLPQFAGCPDSDGDGIKDADDQCPTIKGIASFDGCPDTDGDGIMDSKDNCPNTKGLIELNGCPDADGDGVTDGEDKCPEVAGIKANKGCPEVKEEVKELFTRALTGIKFESGKDIIKTSSFSILDNVVKVMQENPAYNLDIHGHTDSQGDDTKNMDLSRRRAASVKTYLVNKGIGSTRMKTQGFGETRPIANNNTSTGRAQNRRVEFKVNF
ncbi:MAG: OmpA family protein [Bacteroidota bacterium]